MTKEISRKHSALRRSAEWRTNMFVIFGVILDLRARPHQASDPSNDYDGGVPFVGSLFEKRKWMLADNEREME